MLELQASAGEQGWALEPFGEEAPMLLWVVGEEGKALSDAVRRFSSYTSILGDI